MALNALCKVGQDEDEEVAAGETSGGMKEREEREMPEANDDLEFEDPRGRS